MRQPRQRVSSIAGLKKAAEAAKSQKPGPARPRAANHAGTSTSGRTASGQRRYITGPAAAKTVIAARPRQGLQPRRRDRAAAVLRVRATYATMPP